MLSIAIDGPSGAGKSTIARALAKELGFIYVDTGAMYRAIGLYVLRAGGDPADSRFVVPCLADISIALQYQDGSQHILLNGEDVSEDIRRPECSMASSNVSAIPEVRSFLLGQQRGIAQKQNCIMDGRDIGTVVLPDATLKIFLTASPEDRASRRYKELTAKGYHMDFEELLDEIEKRDYNDANRAAAPLKQAEDAVLVDTTGNTLEQSIAQLTALVKEKLHDYL